MLQEATPTPDETALRDALHASFTDRTMQYIQTAAFGSAHKPQSRPKMTAIDALYAGSASVPSDMISINDLRTGSADAPADPKQPGDYFPDRPVGTEFPKDNGTDVELDFHKANPSLLSQAEVAGTKLIDLSSRAELSPINSWIIQASKNLQTVRKQAEEGLIQIGKP